MFATLSYRFATASAEARVLKASGADVNAEVSRLQAELEGKESRLADCAEREEDLRGDLASSEGLRGAARAELAAAQAALNTGAEDFVALERRLCEAELTCERLRSGVETTEMEMSEVRVFFSILYGCFLNFSHGPR